MVAIHADRGMRMHELPQCRWSPVFDRATECVCLVGRSPRSANDDHRCACRRGLSCWAMLFSMHHRGQCSTLLALPRYFSSASSVYSRGHTLFTRFFGTIDVCWTRMGLMVFSVCLLTGSATAESIPPVEPPLSVRRRCSPYRPSLRQAHLCTYTHPSLYLALCFVVLVRLKSRFFGIVWQYLAQRYLSVCWTLRRKWMLANEIWMNRRGMMSDACCSAVLLLCAISFISHAKH